MKKRFREIFFALMALSFSFPYILKAQTSDNCDYLRIAFYNLENFFDPKKDSIKNDGAFTPEGSNHWTYARFYQKRNNICKTLIALGEWCPPAIVGVCELENEWVLSELCNNTPLRKFNYRYIHFESPDARGIDVALLYREKHFIPLSTKAITINFPDSPSVKTRDILHVKGLVYESDTIHFFVVHLPSKLGGAESEIRRNFAGSVLKNHVDSIIMQNEMASIVIMGDFNEGPSGMVGRHQLQVALDTSEMAQKKLFNMTAEAAGMPGSYKYQDQWSTIDQMIISKGIYQKKSLCTKSGCANIFSAPFLLKQDEKYLGQKPFRTYVGLKYEGGFSDHLPVYFDLQKCNKSSE